MDNLTLLYELLQQRDTDVKAEVLLGHVMSNGLQRSDFVVKNSRFFEREFAKDIIAADIVEDEWQRRFAEIQLTRPGFYDLLPESLFFQPDNRDLQKRAGAAEMAAQYQQNKVKEKELRQFFQPFENEFFHQQLLLEKEELALLDALNNRPLNRFLANFWDLPVSLPANAIASFILLIPYAHYINGNVPLMQQCLQLLLNEQVVVSRKEPVPVAAGEALQAGLGHQSLGNDMICGSSFTEDYPVLHYNIGPLQHSPVTAYLEGGVQYLLLETFNRFFIPAEADIITDIQIEKNSGSMQFDAHHQPILGYSSIL